ncbi:DUF1636 domain-containing protein [Neomegalonema perideroedes]|uniref:DUF1636 domain-containing protein n=1 Tax=Neomegalonema perideroedes TaxID=217219 RepID=UPI0003753BF1|nr:DUF1636 domain-containing protein [Neomegalonema perideroedes]
MHLNATLVVCSTCRLPDSDPAAPKRDGLILAEALEAAGAPVRRQECLSACSRGCAVAFTGPKRWTYVQGGLDPHRDREAVLAMLSAYASAPDGLVPWRERPEVIRKNTVARVPPLEV